MTLFNFCLSLTGVWLTLPELQLGLQWRHSKHDVPYLHVTVWRWRAVVSWNVICLQVATPEHPRIWEHRTHWQRNETVKDYFRA